MTRAWAALPLLVACGGGGATPSTDAAIVDATIAVDAAATPDASPLALLQPGAAAQLSPGNAAGQDEDPALLVTRDALYAAWYSNRNGLQPDGRQDKEIFLVRSTDGATWSSPTQLTRSVEWSFAPAIAEDTRGAVHVAWWRMTLLPEGCDPDASCTGTHNRILGTSSTDGVSWSLDEETAITAGPGDWLPALVHDRVGDRLLLYFAAVARDAQGRVDLSERTSRLYRVERTAAGWSQPVRLAGVNPDGTHQSYPHVVQRPDGMFLMTWTRWDAAASSDPVAIVQQPTTNTLYATSTDGLGWSEPRIQSDTGATPAIEVFPHLYADHAGTSFTLTFRTTARGVATGSQVDLPADGSYPADAVDRPDIGGYSAKLVPTRTPGVTWGAWVAGAAPTQKIVHRFVSR